MPSYGSAGAGKGEVIRITVLVSGGGSNLQSIIDACGSGKIDGRVVLVISNKDGVYALQRAAAEGIEACVVDRNSYENDEGFSEEIMRLAKEKKTDIICLAGFLKKLKKNIIKEYPGRILNIHPALLPSYGGKGMYGLRVHRAVLENREKESGCTVHIVNEEYDRGPIVLQRKVPVKRTDTPEELAERVLREEHRAYPDAINIISRKLQ